MAQRGLTSGTSEYHFKFIFLGECQTGKTAIKKQICENQFVQNYKPTLGVEDGVYHDETDQGSFRVVFYDTSGQERFRSMSLTNLNSCQAVFFVYDITNPDTLKALESRIKEVCERKAAANIQKVLLGNKSDLGTADEPDKTNELALKLSAEYKLKMLECSAMTKSSLVKVIHEIVNDLISIQMLKSATTMDDDLGKPFKSHTREKKEEEHEKSPFYNEAIREEPEQTKEDDAQQKDTATQNWKMQGASAQNEKKKADKEETQVQKNEVHVEKGAMENHKPVQNNEAHTEKESPQETAQNHKEPTQIQKKEVVSNQNGAIQHKEASPRNKENQVSVIEESKSRPVEFVLEGPRHSQNAGCNCNIF